MECMKREFRRRAKEFREEQRIQIDRWINYMGRACDGGSFRTSLHARECEFREEMEVRIQMMEDGAPFREFLQEFAHPSHPKFAGKNDSKYGDFCLRCGLKLNVEWFFPEHPDFRGFFHELEASDANCSLVVEQEEREFGYIFRGHPNFEGVVREQKAVRVRPFWVGRDFCRDVDDGAELDPRQQDVIRRTYAIPVPRITHPYRHV